MGGGGLDLCSRNIPLPLVPGWGGEVTLGSQGTREKAIAVVPVGENMSWEG